MTCILDRPSPQALFDRIKGNFSANVLGGYDVIPESLEWYVVSNDYAMSEEFYSVAESQWKARDPRYACCADLYDIAARDGLYPNAASFAQGYIRITGDSGATIPNPLEIVISGQHYLATGTVATTMPSEGRLDVRVKAIVPGTDGNVAVKGTMGNLASTSVGIDSAVKPYGNSFCGGAGPESCEEFRARYLRRIAYTPVANAAWIKSKILEWPCVTRVAGQGDNCCDQQTNGCNCSSCSSELIYYPLFDDTFDCGIPPECVIDDMNRWLFGPNSGMGQGQAPIGVCGRLVQATGSDVNVAISGIHCLSVTAINKIKRRVRDIFASAVPGQNILNLAVSLAVAQVAGTASNFEVTMNPIGDGIALTNCGDLEPDCGVLPCLNSITVVGSDVNDSGC